MSDRTEKASPEHLKNARQRGDIAKSTDFTVAFSSLIWWIALSLLFARGISEAVSWFGDYIQAAIDGADTLVFQPFVGKILIFFFVAMIIPAAIGLIALVSAELVQTRGNLATKHEFISFQRVNPIAGLKNSLNWQKIGALGISLFRFLILASIAMLLGAELLRAIPLMGDAKWRDLVVMFGAMLMRMFTWAVIVCIPIALLDMFWQKMMWQRRNKMSKEQVKREYKDSEGDPHMRGQRRQLHRELIAK